MHPIPTESEKNACPIAIIMVSGLKASAKSHERKNWYPAAAPGMKATRTAITSNNTNKAGIITLEAFSIPFSTPRATMKCVSNINAIQYHKGRYDSWKASNCSLKEKSDANSEPVAELTIYSSDHPAII